jgi:hypothetical protein
LPDDSFDRFVPMVEAVRAEAVVSAARRCIRPADATVIVVGDASICAMALASIGRDVVALSPDF